MEYAVTWDTGDMQFIVPIVLDRESDVPNGIHYVGRRFRADCDVSRSHPLALPIKAFSTRIWHEQERSKGPENDRSESYNSTDGRHYDGSVHVHGFDEGRVRTHPSTF